MGRNIWVVQHADIGIKRNEEFNDWLLKHMPHSDMSANLDVSLEDIEEALVEDPGAAKKFEKELKILKDYIKNDGCGEAVEINLS